MEHPGQPIAVGIDLGTTNCALAYVAAGAHGPEALAIPQILAPGEVGSRPLLPSFLYFAAPGQFADGALDVPWEQGARDVVGAFARAQGATNPGHLISSAKSWLSHAAVDRRAAILPFGATDEVPRLSPVQASARYLAHLRAAWDQAHPSTPLAAQDVVLTVPASFDAVARELTVEAAALAGLPEAPILLEEPQAAMYDWLAQRGDAWRKELAVGDVVLVIDIGGGTTDFSLICVGEQDGVLELSRLAVGDHILLGGDNMDLALAYGIRGELEAAGTNLDDWQMQALTHAVRQAKETLLAEDAPDAVPVVIPGRGRRLVGGTLRAELSRAQLEAVVIEGFLPKVTVDAPLHAPRRVGLAALGLPYPSDAAITRHLGQFLTRNASARAAVQGRQCSFVHPTAILFNGGVTRAAAVRERLMDVLTEWLSREGAPAPRVLSGTDAELAVSRGAAHYAQIRRQGGVRIRGGTAQTYYVGIERSELAVPGIPPRIDAVCVAPAGMEEGTEVELPQQFALILDEPVWFRFFASASRRDDAVGAVVQPRELTEVAPIETTLAGTPGGPAGQRVQVQIHVRVTEIGTLDLFAVEVGQGRRWKLSFDVRGQE